MNAQSNILGVMHAFDILPDGACTRLDPSEITSLYSVDTVFRWVHVDLNQADARARLAEFLDETVTQSLTLEDTRPRCVRHDDGVLLNLRGVNLNPGSDPEDMVSIRIWATKSVIVSARLRRLIAVRDLRAAFEAGEGPRSVGAFLSDLAAGLTERMDDVISELADKAAELEEASLAQTPNLRSEIADVRRTAIMLRRYIAPQREALSRLISEGAALLDEDARISVRETVDRITRMVEELDAVRERGAILHDQLTDKRAEEMNRNMLILSVVAAIFLPLGFLTGLLGVNVGGIPGTDYPLAFGIVCAITLGLAATLAFVFKKLKWI